jgi:hypothetical protein
MGQINPFTGAVTLHPSQSVADRNRRSLAASKNLPADEAADHVVENPDAVVMIGDEHSQRSPDKRHEQPEDEKAQSERDDKPAHLDVTA